MSFGHGGRNHLKSQTDDQAPHLKGQIECARRFVTKRARPNQRISPSVQLEIAGRFRCSVLCQRFSSAWEKFILRGQRRWDAESSTSASLGSWRANGDIHNQQAIGGRASLTRGGVRCVIKFGIAEHFRTTVRRRYRAGPDPSAKHASGQRSISASARRPEND